MNLGGCRLDLVRAVANVVDSCRRSRSTFHDAVPPPEEVDKTSVGLPATCSITGSREISEDRPTDQPTARPSLTTNAPSGSAAGPSFSTSTPLDLAADDEIVAIRTFGTIDTSPTSPNRVTDRDGVEEEERHRNVDGHVRRERDAVASLASQLQVCGQDPS